MAAKTAPPFPEGMLNEPDDKVRPATGPLPVVVSVGAERPLEEPRKLTGSHKPKATADRASTIDRLLKTLDSQDSEARRMAAGELGWYGSKARRALPALYKTLDDESPHVRIACTAAIWEIVHQPVAVVPVLLELLQSDDDAVRTLTAHALGNIGSGAKRGLPDLHRVLTASSGLFRVNIAEAILRIDAEDKPAFDALIRSFEDPSTDVRCQAAYALSAAVGPRSAEIMEELSALQNDADPRVQSAAKLTAGQLAETSAQTADKKARDATSEKLAKLVAELQGDDATRRKDAAAQLAWMGADAKPVLTAIEQRLNDESAVVRATAAWAMWEVGRRSSTATKTLLPLLDSEDENLSTLAAYVLGSMRKHGQLSLSALRRKMENCDGMLQIHLAEAIAKIDPLDRPAVDRLTAALEDENPDVRGQAAFALSAVGVQQVGRVIPPLVSRLQDDEPRVRSAAKLTLLGFLESKQSGLTGLTAYVLGWTGTSAAPMLPKLRRLLDVSSGLERLQLAEAIVKIDAQDEAAIGVLTGGLDSSAVDVRRQAAYALAGIGPRHIERVRNPLSLATKDSNEKVREAAHSTLGFLGIDLAGSGSRLAKRTHTTTPQQRLSPRRVTASSTHGDVVDLAKRLPPAPKLPIQLEPDDEIVGKDKTGSTPQIIWADSDETVEAPVPAAKTKSEESDGFESSGLESLGDAIVLPLSGGTQSMPLKNLQPNLLPLDVALQNRRTVRFPITTTLQQFPAADSGVDGSPTMEARADFFNLADKSLVAFARANPVDEDGNRQSMPEEDLVAEEAYRAIREAASYGDAAINQPMGMSRGWVPHNDYWEASASCHRPVYFEETNLERYGNSVVLVQPVVSAAHFVSTAGSLPYLMVVQPPQKCTYTLGHYRPGSDIPFRHHRLPIRLDAELAEAATIWGLVLLAH